MITLRMYKYDRLCIRLEYGRWLVQSPVQELFVLQNTLYIVFHVICKCCCLRMQIIWRVALSSSHHAMRCFSDLLEPWDVRELYIRKTADCPCNSALAHFHVSWLSDFIFYPKPLYKLLHQSFFYSFITIKSRRTAEESRTIYPVMSI
jgi:hypothetical protein